jgi:hypothetical protein
MEVNDKTTEAIYDLLPERLLSKEFSFQPSAEILDIIRPALAFFDIGNCDEEDFIARYKDKKYNISH